MQDSNNNKSWRHIRGFTKNFFSQKFEFSMEMGLTQNFFVENHPK